MSEKTDSPFTRPGFIAAAVIVALILVMAIALIITNATRGDADSAASASPDVESSSSTEPEEPEPQPASNSKGSVCGLKGEVLEKARLPQRPKVDAWDYVARVAYPVSKEYGPGAEAPKGYPYCFQRSPEGALFAASYMLAASGGTGSTSAWAEYVTSKKSPNRAKALELLNDDEQTSAGSLRVSLVGFRLLSYDGTSATVDLAARVMDEGQTAYASMIFDLVWEDGDWKFLPKNTEDPGEFTQLPDISSYIPWGSE